MSARTRKQEATVLREIVRMYRSPTERVANYTHSRLIAMGFAWAFIFAAFLLFGLQRESGVVQLVLALLGGIAMGIAFMLALSIKQIPLFARYTTLNEEDVQKRLDELSS